jgi:hypothetical protein
MKINCEYFLKYHIQSHSQARQTLYESLSYSPLFTQIVCGVTPVEVMSKLPWIQYKSKENILDCKTQLKRDSSERNAVRF